MNQLVRLVRVAGVSALMLVASSSLAGVIGGNDLLDRPYVDVADGIIFFDQNGQISTDGTIDSWSIFAAQTGGEQAVDLPGRGYHMGLCRRERPRERGPRRYQQLHSGL
ncbi:MAG: hypothetical protein QGG02_08695 [Gammaproteobacteria bacterium]|nr:hypothetical protein [Gammaproteobacteria bacterium]MDP6731680.1 hypothetical protein [Gammaproteobacteria bacterium]|tara:strand:+ start:132 stop:458 length:327 start_codon:yes stop_codon:yes gene_type:complete